MSKNPTVIVAGGGIGGLSAALGLANKGCAVTVLEQADRFGEIGAGIQIGPNAFHAMDYLGVGDAGRAKAVYIDRLIMMDGMTGAAIAEIPVDEPFRRRFGNPSGRSRPGSPVAGPSAATICPLRPRRRKTAASPRRQCGSRRR
jgi:2-polyprenyl-6-methoxyphenol hydroxylase-like FAD-dependent oxidoreductase